MAANAARKSACHTETNPASPAPAPAHSPPPNADAGPGPGPGSDTDSGSSAPAGTALVTTPVPFDPTGLGTLPAIPLVPAAVLRRHHAFVPTDTRFRSAARLLQCLWREDRGLEPGRYRDGAGRTRKLGSRITAAAGRRGGNFIHPLVARLVERELIYREIGAVIEEERLRENLLSSQPICFNAFGPLKLDLRLATAVFAELLPGFMAEVTDIRFEHSPARGHGAFTADGTAFDLLVRGHTGTGQRAFVAIEMKYTEGCTEPLPRFSGQFDAIAAGSNLFVDPTDPNLRANPVQQLFRQGCLAAAMLRNELYDVGIHVLIAPRDNHLAQNAGLAYAGHLTDPVGERLPFRTIALETLFGAIEAAGAPDLARVLHRRYTDLWLIDGELELEGTAPSANDDAPFGMGTRADRGTAPANVSTGEV